MNQKLIDRAINWRWYEPKQWELTESEEDEILRTYDGDPLDFSFILDKRITKFEDMVGLTIESFDPDAFPTWYSGGKRQLFKFTNGQWCIIDYYDYYDCLYCEIDNELFSNNEYLAEESKSEEKFETLNRLTLLTPLHYACGAVLKIRTWRNKEKEAEEEKYKEYLKLKEEFER